MEYEKLAELIEPFINGPFSAMSDELRKSVTNALFPMPHWDELKPGGRLSLAKQHDSQLAEYNLGWELDNQIEDIQFEIDKRKSTPTLGQVELDLKNVRISELEAKKAELENSLDYETFEVEHWFSKTVVTSTEAALLLCKHNPNKITSDDTECCTNPKTGRKDIVQLKQRFDALNKKEPGERTLRDWLEYARSQKIKYHSWIDGYAETLPSPDTKPIPTDADNQPVACDTAIDNSDSDRPKPITTPVIANCFAELNGSNDFSVERWKKELGSPKKWLLDCQAKKGERPEPSTWWPVLIGGAIVKKNTGRNKERVIRSVRGRFQSQEPLKPWLDEWKTYETDNFDTE